MCILNAGETMAMERAPAPVSLRPSAQIDGHPANRQIIPPRAVTQAVFPDMTLTSLNDETVALSDRINFFFNQGKPFVIVHFWATWCASCLHELPLFSEHHKKALDDTDNLLAPVITVALEQTPPERIADYLKNKANAPHLDTFTSSLNDAVSAFQARGLPLTVFMHKDGTEFRRIEGAHDWGAKGAFSR